MSNLTEFIDYLEEQVENMSIYVWGAQGQGYPTLNESWIKSKESGTHEKDALKKYREAVAAGKQKVCRAFDCSGLGVYWIYNLKKIWSGDKNANGMMGQCTLITKAEVKKGCWVFKRYKTGTKRAYHIGYVVDDNLNVVEAQGRAYGVVKRPLSKGGWNAYGIPKIFASEIVGADVPATKFTRILKKGCKGADVAELQKLLNKAGDSIVVDGDFGSKTLAAVKAYQKRKGLKVDGVVGKKTIAALKVNESVSTVFTISRILKKGCEGDDVKALQTELISVGFSCGSTAADGDFGENTENAVKRFQTAAGLKADGIAGQKTVVALGGKWNG